MFTTKIQGLQNKKQNLIVNRQSLKEKIKVINAKIDKIVSEIHDEELKVIHDEEQFITNKMRTK